MLTNNQRPKVGILQIATGAYAQFIESLFPYTFNNFLPDCDTYLVLFTDSEHLIEKYKYHPYVFTFKQQHLGWPYDTLKRFEIFIDSEDKNKLLEQFDYLFFLNANAYVKNRILAQDLLIPNTKSKDDLICVQHAYQLPHLAKNKSFDRNPESLAYIPEDSNYNQYVFGAFNGGTKDAFLTMVRTLKKRVDTDLAKGIIAFWHDESHLNRYIYEADHSKVKILTPQFLLPQEYTLDSIHPGERDKVKIILLYKKAITNLDALRNKEQPLTDYMIDYLVGCERTVESRYLERKEYYDKLSKESSITGMFDWKFNFL